MVRMLTVATIAPTLQAFLLPFARHFRARGWRMDALARDISTSQRCQDAFDHVWDIDWSRNPFSPRNVLGAAREVRSIVTREQYDLVHVHTPVAAFVTRYALKTLPQGVRPKVVYTAHGFHFREGASWLKNSVYGTLEKVAGPWTDELIVINRDDEVAAHKRRLLPREHIHYMPGIGVDLAHYGPEGTPPAAVRRVREDLNIPQEAELLLCVAEFIPRKRHQDVLGAFARLDRPNVHLILPSTGPLVEAMQNLSVTLGVSDRVHFLGNVRNVPALMLASRAVILASTQEGLPRCVMEAMCAGVPVIASNARGTRELIDEECGLLFEIGDAEALSDAMAWVLDHPREAQSLGQAARAKVDAFDLQRVLSLHEELYSRVLGDPEAPARAVVEVASGFKEAAQPRTEVSSADRRRI